MISRTPDLPALPKVPLGASIPKIIHQVMMQGWDALPPEIVENIRNLRACNPEWEYRFYDAARAEAFIKAAYGSEVLEVYRRIDPNYFATRSDLFRYLACYADGGMYLDVKSITRRPLDKVLRPDDVYILGQWPDLIDVPGEAAGTLPAAHPELAHIPGYEYLNWFILAAPGHPFLRAVIQNGIKNIINYDPFRNDVGRRGSFLLTGPINYTLSIHDLRATSAHRIAHVVDDLGLQFSIYDDVMKHRRMVGAHYSDMVRPVVRQGPVKTALTEAWFGSLKPQMKRVKRKLGLS